MDTLMELTEDYQALMEYADSTDPDDQQCFLDTLEGLKGAINLKFDAYHAVMCQVDGQIDVLDREIKLLTARKKALVENRKRMDGALIEVIDRIGDTDKKTGKKYIQTDLHKYSIVNNGGVVPLVVDEEQVPDAYKKVILETDNQKIRDALEKGEELTFAHLGERGRRLSIK